MRLFPLRAYLIFSATIAALFLISSCVSSSDETSTGEKRNARKDSGNPTTSRPSGWVGPTSLTLAPIGRWDPILRWTGTELIVWGGNSSFFEPDPEAAILDPVTNRWRSISKSGAPKLWYFSQVIWTGSQLIVWGGCTNMDRGSCGQTQGAIYDLALDQWTPMNEEGAPVFAMRATSVWTGSEMLVWGGRGAFTAQGAAYNPSLNKWRAINRVQSPDAPVGDAVWTGTHMIVCGGLHTANWDCGIYDPKSDTWERITASAFETDRQLNAFHWTGSKLILWGGWNGSRHLMTGSIYDLETKTWSKMSEVNAPTPRSWFSSVWTGKKMIVWGGSNGEKKFSSGGIYDPETNRWEEMPTENAPSERLRHAAIWTGDKMIVWGGASGPASDYSNSGGYFIP